MAKKAGNGEGTIGWHAAKGCYVAALSYTDASGARKRKYLYSRISREDCADKLKVALAEQVRGIQPTVDTRSLAAYLADWLEQDVRPSRSKGTTALYETLIRRHIVPTIGTVKLTSIGPKDVQRVQAALLKAKLAPNSIRSVRECLSVALNRAVRWGLIPKNPVPLVDPVRLPDIEPDVLTPEQAAALLAAAADHDARYLYVVLLSTGLRISEALGLVWRDVDLNAGTLRVSKQLARGRDFERTELKTRGSRRSIPLTPQAVAALHALRSLSRARRMACEVTWAAADPLDDFVFSNEAGEPWRANSSLITIKAHAKKAGLPASTHLHTLRHSCATYLLAAGVSDKVVMVILGHSSLRMTAHYTHAVPSMLSEARDALARVFPDAPAGGVSAAV